MNSPWHGWETGTPAACIGCGYTTHWGKQAQVDACASNCLPWGTKPASHGCTHREAQCQRAPSRTHLAATWSAALAAATTGRGSAVEKITARPLFSSKRRRRLLQATNPPKLPTALLSVPTWTSTCSMGSTQQHHSKHMPSLLQLMRMTFTHTGTARNMTPGLLQLTQCGKPSRFSPGPPRPTSLPLLRPCRHTPGWHGPRQ